MGLFWKNIEKNKEEDGDLENNSTKVRQSLAELECEEVIIEDNEEFGRVRTNLMKVLRAKHGDDIANRALGRMNKRKQEGYLKS